MTSFMTVYFNTKITMVLLLGKDLKHRWVRHFGYEFNYDTNNVDENSPMQEPIPGYLDSLIARMIELGLLPRKPEQLTINSYKPGQGLNHILQHRFVFLHIYYFR
jgi:alkylated DNA repair protein alkB family protein 8